MRNRTGIPGRMSRLEFLSLSGKGMCLLAAARLCGGPETAQAQRPIKGLVGTKLSPHFTPLPGGEVRCELCPRRCRVAKGKRGLCRVDRKSVV